MYSLYHSSTPNVAGRRCAGTGHPIFPAPNLSMVRNSSFPRGNQGLKNIRYYTQPSFFFYQENSKKRHTISHKTKNKKAAVDSPSLLNITINPSQDNMCTIMPAPILGQTWTRLHSRWSSSSRDIFDKPPSKPLSCRRMSEGRPSSATSVKESHQEDPGTSKVRRPHQSDSMWTSGGAGTTTVRPPLLRGKAFRWTSGGTGTTTVRPPLRRGKAFKRYLQGACRWTSSSRSALDRVPTPAPAPHRMIVGSSSVSALKPSVEMKDRDIFEIAQMALCIFNVPGKPPASIKSPVCCLPPRMTTHAPIITENALTPPTSMTPHSPVVSKRAYAA
jgi:hypothetical protein